MTSPNILAPLRTAPHENVVLVHHPERNTPSHVAQSIEGRFRLASRRTCAAALGSKKELPPFPEAPETQDWQDALTTINCWSDNFIAQRDFTEYAKVYAGHQGDQAQYVQKVAREGNATIIAFLEVIPRLLFRRSFDQPNRVLADYARRSSSLMTQWSGVHAHVDYRLAYALASPKPKDIEVVFDNLRFHTKWFIEDEAEQVVTLNPNKLRDLRDHRGRHPRLADDGKSPLFACAARHLLPTIIGGAVNLVESADLFGITYTHERRNHGYEH